MHEFSLYGVIDKADYARVRQQLAGVARMQPQAVEEIHLIFRARTPAGVSHLPSAGGSQGVAQQDVQRLKNMLNGSLYHIQLVGELLKETPSSGPRTPSKDVPDAQNGNGGNPSTVNVRWTLEFRDTPDAGKQSVSSRLVSKTALTGGSLVLFLQQFGYEYISRYFVQGCKFFDDSTTMFLHQVLQLPQSPSVQEAIDVSLLPPATQLQPVDPGQQYLLQASINVTDGVQPELKERATQQLLALKQILKQAVDLTPGDRLALDTKVPQFLRRS